jgi:chemotaxis protein methyltransferase CheR
MINDQHFRRLLARFGLSWDGYRRVRKGVKKRVVRHMQELGCRNFDCYLEQLDRNPALASHCNRLLDVSISRFFRDRRLWHVLENNAVPIIVSGADETIWAWSAGCSLGQEAYSLKILWNEVSTLRSPFPKLKILASDINTTYLEKARKGIYPKSALKEVPESWLNRYFVPVSGMRSFAIIESLKADIYWEARDFLSALPPECFHLIFLRNNLLTYYDEKIRLPGFERIISRLHNKGFLVIGSHEKIPVAFRDRLTPFSHSGLYQKIGRN